MTPGRDEALLNADCGMLNTESKSECSPSFGNQQSAFCNFRRPPAIMPRRVRGSPAVIQFPCPCGHAFALDDDQAGGFVQCPACYRLNDVPGLGELQQIATDGTYKIEAPAQPPDRKQVVSDLAYIYQKGARDDDGNEIDLRLTPTERQAVGRGEPVPLLMNGLRRKRMPPRYDPETGELVTSFDLIDDGRPSVNPADIPMAKPALTYASGPTVVRHSFLRLFVDLLMPLNIAVMIAVFAGIVFLIVAILILGGTILAHYGNVIEDIGPHKYDELPRPLRDVGWHEDLWSPLLQYLRLTLDLLRPWICFAGPSASLPYYSTTGAIRPGAPACGVRDASVPGHCAHLAMWGHDSEPAARPSRKSHCDLRQRLSHHTRRLVDCDASLPVGRPRDRTGDL